ncbi:Proton-coupled amino acid transporter 4 [Pseudolycoriella hygida]|uniref:Proton-coupled amino acid transporter 4 n=1 Tax=Pseudolycoriella hygida TaxID=35572 RepID=A0A9Q0RZ56_9DIPT|nr:Proton-coupled amino acid transporter 4 [Pseudolycoriella hygida]
MEMVDRKVAPYIISNNVGLNGSNGPNMDMQLKKTGAASKEVLTIRDEEKPKVGKNVMTNNAHDINTDHPTSYVETIMHLLRGNIGSGIFAMGDGFKNGGLLLAPVLTLFIGIASVHSQHILLKVSERMKETFGYEYDPDFAETVELAFESGPRKFRDWSRTMKRIVNIFICVTQIGFCAIYFVFISSSLKQVFDFYGYNLDVHLHMLFTLVPMLIPSLITNLKYLAPCSMIANVCMATGIGVVYYYAFQDLPNISERNYVPPNVNKLPLFFGTAIFAFEGIALVLPLKNAMKNPKNFTRPAGVLNVGMTFVATLLITFGFFGYLQWGEKVAGSLTLNLPQHEILAQVVKITVSLGMWLTFPLQFFVPIQIMWPKFQQKFGPFKHPTKYELIFRIFMVLLTFAIAESVPRLNLFISLIGALCATALALVFPPVIQLISSFGSSEGPGVLVLVKDSAILLIALLGFSTGTYESISALANAFYA